MPAQPWLTALNAIDKRAFAVLKGTATPEQRAVVLRFIEHPTHLLDQEKNARFVAALVNGHSTLSKEPCPPTILTAGLSAWLEQQDAAQSPSPNYITAITYVDDAWNQSTQQDVVQTVASQLDTGAFQCASLRNWKPEHPVWVVKCGMIDFSDPRHPHRKIAGTSAVLQRDGMYHLPRPPLGGTLNTHSAPNTTQVHAP